jgi:hypothetical protein
MGSGKGGEEMGGATPLSNLLQPPDANKAVQRVVNAVDIEEVIAGFYDGSTL